MLSFEVKQLIETEIARVGWSFTNAHGVDLKKCLIEPQKISCHSTFSKLGDVQSLLLWNVLEEMPNQRQGYLIVFDDVKQKFGLAFWGDDAPIFLGYYGGFITTLEAM